MPVSVQIAESDDDDPDVNRMRFAGQVTLIDTKIEPVTQSVRVWAEVNNRDGFLKDGMIATMLIHRPQGVRHPAEAGKTIPATD